MTEQPSMDWKPRMVSITGDGLSARIALDGTDVSDYCQDFTIEHRVGQVPLVVLHAQAKGGVAFEGLAQVAVATEQDQGQAIADYLKGINPTALDVAALEREDLDGGRNELTRAMLAQLIDWAQGK